jgi:hypothetical protein
MSTKVTRGNKRIVAPQHERPIRLTRQRMAEINQESTHSLNVHAHHNSSAATNYESTQSIDTATQPTSLIHEEGDNHNGEEGKRTLNF